MKKLLQLLIMEGLLFAVSLQTQAVILFEDNFDSQND